MPRGRGRPVLLYLPGAEALARKTIATLDKDWQLMPIEVRYFADGEVKTLLPTGDDNSVRGADTFVMQVADPNYPHSRQDTFFELCSALAALTECSAGQRTAVIPWYSYACQDKARRREPVTAKLAADFLTVSGATHVVAVDVHNDAIGAFFNRRQCTFDHLYASGLLVDFLEKQFGLLSQRDNFVISGVDAGGSTRIKHLANHYGLTPVTPTKVKDYGTGQTREIIIQETVAGKTVVVIDDMVRSGSSIVETTKAHMAKGANKVIIAATHADFCGNSLAQLDRLFTEGILLKAVFTDSFNIPDDFAAIHPWFAEVSLYDMLARTISCVHTEQSVGNVRLEEE
ncbi:MAG: ribose-phosphate diphosphokinase [Patescibacteria group bacterium]|jgi:ribose-phosphate pyrophosphokinase